MGCISASIERIYLKFHVRTLQTVRMNFDSLVAVSQILQCGWVISCSWPYEMYTDVPVGHVTQILIYMAAVCCWWLRSVFNIRVWTVGFMHYWDNPWNK